jgi:cell shape-determining protein MreD
LILLFPKFIEIIFLGFFLDILSGAPFGVFTFIFALTLFLLERFKKYIYVGQN